MNTAEQHVVQTCKNNRRTDMLTAEVIDLSKWVVRAHRTEVTQLACLIHLVRQMRKCPSASLPVVGLSMAPMRQLQRDCVQAWMSVRGITQDELQSAITSLERAEGTLGYLDSLPG